MEPALIERLAALKAKSAPPAPVLLPPENKSPFPLRAFLLLLAKATAGELTYNERRDIFFLLHEWLAPIDIGEQELRAVPHMLARCDYDYMAYTLKCTSSKIYYTYLDIYHKDR